MLRVTVSRPTIRRENLVHSNHRKVKSHLFGIGSSILPALLRGHKSTGKCRNKAHEASETSISQFAPQRSDELKAAGVSDFMAREIVGHESAAVSRQYTHLTTDDKRTAMQRLPDVTDT